MDIPDSWSGEKIVTNLKNSYKTTSKQLSIQSSGKPISRLPNFIIILQNLSLIHIFTRGQVSEQVAGPIGIVSVFSQVINFGPRFVLLFVASISLSLAVINSLPLPALDGGRQFVLILQKIGFKITPERENFVHLIGFVALIILMIIISISDISKLR